MTKRVVHIFGVMDVGGAELRTIELLEALSGDDIQFIFVTLSGNRGVLAERIESLGGRVVPLRIGWRFPARLVRLLRAESVAAVDSHVAKFSGAVLFLARLAGVPTRIAHFHSDGDGKSHGLSRRVYRVVMSALIRACATEIVAVSPSALELGYGMRARTDDRCAVLPNGVSRTRLLSSAGSLELPKHEGTPVLISVGRASPEKNLERMPEILYAYVLRHGEARLVFLGPRDPAIDARVRSIAERLAVDHLIDFLEPVPNVGDALMRADALILTSTREGLPSVVIEAASLGLPVISSDVGGSVWISQHLPGIVTVPLTASDETWADAVHASLATRTERSRDEAAQVFDASIFSMPRAAARYRELVSRR